MSTFESEAARLLVLGLPFTPGVMQWRHHGLGMLQAELSETLRVHVWHPRLVSPGMVWPRCVHDHRFDITSAVVVGEIIDVPCRVREVPEPFSILVLPAGAQWVDVFEIEHAKKQEEGKGCSTATGLKKLVRAYVEEEGFERRKAGDVYSIDRREFHTTRVEGLAITMVHRSNFDDRLARVLCAPDADVKATSGIVRDNSPEHTELVNSVLREAADAVYRMPGMS